MVHVSSVLSIKNITEIFTHCVFFYFRTGHSLSPFGVSTDALSFFLAFAKCWEIRSEIGKSSVGVNAVSILGTISHLLQNGG